MAASKTYTFYEFFAGGGMARAGLGLGWTCLFANDFDHKKAITYRRNWSLDGNDVLRVADVRSLNIADMPHHPDLVWASFPCQDLSLAGGGAGLKGDRSGTFWPFWKHIQALKAAGRKPKAIVLENVCGTLTSHKGKDFAGLCEALNGEGYRYGAVVIDAAQFLPQSRPRLFIIAVSNNAEVPGAVACKAPVNRWHTASLQYAHSELPEPLKESWVWWNIPEPKQHRKRLLDIVEDDPKGVSWHTPEETKKLLAMMSAVNRTKVEKVIGSGQRAVGAIYKRTRFFEGAKVQRAEVRFDNLSGCLRTPAGGSSRQIILLIEGERVRSRLISARETARLMGLKEDYVLPENYNEAYHLTGDGIVVPVVRHIAKYVLEPIIDEFTQNTQEAA